MYQRTWRVTVLTSLIIALGGFSAADVQGGQVLDWLFGGGSSTNKQVVAYYPPTAYAPQPGMAYQAYYGGQPTVAYQVPAANVYAPTAACPPPAAACCPQPVVCPPQPTNSWSWLGSCFGGRSSPSPAVVPSINPIPQTYYRTTWKRVPVTSFRPVTSADPITGCPVTVMKPCTTYTWQADRRECNFFDRLLGRCSRAPAATQPCCVPTECMATASDCCGGPASYGVPVMASPSPTPAPYYAPGNSTTVPGLPRHRPRRPCHRRPCLRRLDAALTVGRYRSRTGTSGHPTASETGRGRFFQQRFDPAAFGIPGATGSRPHGGRGSRGHGPAATLRCPRSASGQPAAESRAGSRCHARPDRCEQCPPVAQSPRPDGSAAGGPTVGLHHDQLARAIGPSPHRQPRPNPDRRHCPLRQGRSSGTPHGGTRADGERRHA